MNTGKGTDTVLALQLIAGTKQHFSTASTLTIGNVSVTPAQLEASLQRLVDMRAAVDDAKAATQAKIATEDAEAPSLRRQMAAYVAYVKATFGQTPDVLASFGLKPTKARTPLTIEQKAAASAKRAATRAARHTMGSKQKKDVKGTITTIVSTPTTSAPAPIAPSPVVSAPAQGTSAGTAPHV
jgi:hypothetical protein